MDSKTIAQAFEELTKFAEANFLAMQKSNEVMGDQKKILEQTKASSQNLMNTAHKLNEAVAKFKVADE
jgi:methyl-accepting chemotaxis protein